MKTNEQVCTSPPSSMHAETSTLLKTTTGIYAVTVFVVISYRCHKKIYICSSLSNKSKREKMYHLHHLTCNMNWGLLWDGHGGTHQHTHPHLHLHFDKLKLWRRQSDSRLARASVGEPRSCERRTSKPLLPESSAACRVTQRLSYRQ